MIVSSVLLPDPIIDKKLYAIKPDCAKKWEFTTGDSIYSSPAIGADGTIYIGSSDSKLYAIESNGKEKWKFTAGGPINSSPAIEANGTIYVGSKDNKFYAIKPDGKKKWKFVVGDWVEYLGSGNNPLL